jgi:hypothetical protein
VAAFDARVGSMNDSSPHDDLDGALHWRWEDLAWRKRVGGDPKRIAREALRRAVDLRDANAADPRSLRARPVFLVDVMNRLCEVLNVETDDLWGRV